MEIIRTSIQVTQTVKNVSRLRTILGVFGRHGLQEFLMRMGLERYIPATARAEGVDQRTLPERLRLAFEELGPTFVKLGQILSNRPDMIPDEFIQEFKNLQDNVAPVSDEIMKKFIEIELGRPVDTAFQYFNPTPIASASIGQVYEARLNTGEEVVLKVQRPDIERIIKNDEAILRFLAGLMEKYIPETRMISPSQLVEEFFTTLKYELDFAVEANTTVKVAENLKGNKRIVIPKVYREYCTGRLLTLERLNGVRITDTDKVRAMGLDPKELVEIGARAFFKMLMQDGLFHGDMHGGNLFAMKNPETGEAQIGVIDFGIVGRLAPTARDALTRMVVALVTEDYENLCYEYAELGALGTGIDFESFQREVRNSVSPYVGLSLKDVKIGPILINSTRIALKYNIRMPSDWMIVFKAIFSLEGLGRQLDPNFDMLSIGQDLVKVAAKEKYSLEKFMREFSWTTRDLIALIQIAPRQIRWMFRKFNSNDFAFEIKIREFEVMRRQVEKSFRGVGMSVVCASLFIAAAISLQAQNTHMVRGYPISSIVFFGMGLLGFLGLTFRSWK